MDLKQLKVVVKQGFARIRTIKSLQVILSVYFVFLCMLLNVALSLLIKALFMGATIGYAIALLNQTFGIVQAKNGVDDGAQVRNILASLTILIAFKLSICITVLICVWKRVFLVRWSILLTILTFLFSLYAFLSGRADIGLITLLELIPNMLVFLLGLTVKAKRHRRGGSQPINSSSSNSSSKPISTVVKSNSINKQSSKKNADDDNDDNEDEIDVEKQSLAAREEN